MFIRPWMACSSPLTTKYLPDLKSPFAFKSQDPSIRPPRPGSWPIPGRPLGAITNGCFTIGGEGDRDATGFWAEEAPEGSGSGAPDVESGRVSLRFASASGWGSGKGLRSALVESMAPG